MRLGPSAEVPTDAFAETGVDPLTFVMELDPHMHFARLRKGALHMEPAGWVSTGLTRFVGGRLFHRGLRTKLQNGLGRQACRIATLQKVPRAADRIAEIEQRGRLWLSVAQGLEALQKDSTAKTY